MSKRLLSFGCSLTYGHGLLDCFSEISGYGDRPSKYAWPQLVANDLGYECINYAVPGASSKYVSYLILNTKFQADDTVIIWWPEFDRTTYITSKNITKLGAWPLEAVPKNNKVGRKLLENWHHKLVNVEADEGLTDRAMWITLTNSYLEYKVKTVKNFIEGTKQNKFGSPLVKCDPEPHIIPTTISRGIDRALDGKHPGLKAHQKIAQIALSTLV